MAIVLIEGFDHMAAADIVSKGWTNNLPASMPAGRFGGACARFNTTNAAVKALPASYATLIGGFAGRISALLSGTDFYVMKAGATSTVRVSVNASNKLQVRNSGGTVIATGTTALLANVFYYVEVKAFINGASGTVEVRLNGVAEIASTVGNFGSTNLDTIVVAGATSAGSTDFDDLYVADTTGSAPRNTFLGDVRVATIKPSADGAHSQYTPNSGTAHFSRVNETLADGDTSYVSDATVGDLDTYAFEDVDGAATVFGAQVVMQARKDDAGTRQIAPVIRQSGTDNVGTTVTLTSSYAFYTQIYNQDPVAADWTPTTINADEFGVKTIA